MKIVSNTLDLDKESFVRTIQHSFAGIIKIMWENVFIEEKDGYLRTKSYTKIIGGLVTILKHYFLGKGYHDGQLRGKEESVCNDVVQLEASGART